MVAAFTREAIGSIPDENICHAFTRSVDWREGRWQRQILITGAEDYGTSQHDGQRAGGIYFEFIVHTLSFLGFNRVVLINIVAKADVVHSADLRVTYTVIVILVTNIVTTNFDHRPDRR
jgi:hypothetical protein